MIPWRPQKEDTERPFLAGGLSTDLTEESSIIEILNHTISTDKTEICNLVLIALEFDLSLRSQSTGHQETEDALIERIPIHNPDPVIVALAERANIEPDLRELMKAVATGKAEPPELARFQRVIDNVQNKLAMQAREASNETSSNAEMDQGVVSKTQESMDIRPLLQGSGLDQRPKDDNPDALRLQEASSVNPDHSGRSLHPETAAFFLQSIQELLVENRRLRGELNDAQSANKILLDKQRRDKDNESECESAYEDSEALNEQSESDNESNERPHHWDFQSTLRMIHCHLVVCNNGGWNYFEDSPMLFRGDSRTAHLRGRIGIDLQMSLQQPSDIAFAVIKRYKCSCGEGPTDHHVVGYENGRLIGDAPAPDSTSEHIWMHDSLLHAVQGIIAASPHEFQGFGSTGYSARIFAPYLLFYIHNGTFLTRIASSTLEPRTAEALRLLCTWFEEHWREAWDEADEKFSRGKVTPIYYSLLFRPDELIRHRSFDYPRDDHDQQEPVRIDKVQPYPWKEGDEHVDLVYWQFNGLFQRFSWSLDITWEPSIYRWDGEKDITSLRYSPLRFWGADLTRQLVLRGHQFWKCRRKRLVALRNMEGDGGSERTEARFMIDYDMFKRMYPKKAMFASQFSNLGEEEMEKDEPPGDDFLAMMPSKIDAFELARKAWKQIRVDCITDVSWNKDAFKRLVIASEDKELIEAAITAHGSQPISAPDIIAGKGQGLLILLHGGPGTGKTLTAESIAEAQERPLYRVTCGDIGIEPTEAEKYLQSVLTVGETWGCVILMDEADVFLEERNIADQKQNAFVSVFLRLLEYYNGTVLLTTNRVGTFDEAFKSRIHLALKYQNLDEEQRAGIWRNFVDMLRGTKDLIDVEDLERNVPRLAQIEMNGRQIRNTLTIARYLAKFRKQVLVYKHIQDAIASVVKFDQYLTTLRGSDDSWARDARLR